MFQPVSKPIKAVRPKKEAIQVREILAVDFDGVIHDKANPIEGKRMGAPIQGAKEAMEQLHKRYTLVIHTVMATSTGGTQAAEDWMKYYQIPFDEVTSTKPNAKYYLDDKAVKFISWPQALQEIM